MAADAVNAKLSSEVLAENIHKFMRKKKISDAKLGLAMGVTRQTVWRWRTGVDEPTSPSRDTVASILGVPVHRLFMTR